MESGLQRTYDDNYARANEPEFVAPPDLSGAAFQMANFSSPFMNQTYPFYSFPGMPPKPVNSYLSPDFKQPAPLFPFPESIPGLVERAQPIFMFLVCPQSASANPLVFLHRLITEKSRHYKVLIRYLVLKFGFNYTLRAAIYEVRLIPGRSSHELPLVCESEPKQQFLGRYYR